MADPDKGFVILREPETGHFVQLLKVGDDALVFDLPLGGMDDETHARALAFFGDRGVKTPVLQGRQGVYQRDFTGDAPGLEEASEFATAVLEQVFGLPEAGELEVTYGSG
jgi:hypothetical protein